MTEEQYLLEPSYARQVCQIHTGLSIVADLLP